MKKEKGTDIQPEGRIFPTLKNIKTRYSTEAFYVKV